MSPRAGLGRLGRVRAVLRLGERADAGAARRAVLAPGRAGARRAGARARMRHRAHLAAARARRRRSRRHRSIGADARRALRAARRQPPAASPIGALRLVRGDIRVAAVRRRASFEHGHRAVRHPAVAARDAISRRRSSRCARARAGRHLRARSRARRAELARVHEPRPAARPAARGVHLTLIESVRQDRARRLTTFEQRYVERRNGRSTEHRFELTFRTLSVQRMTRAARTGRLRRRSRARRLPRPAVGRARGCLDHPREKEVEFLTF